MPTADSGRASGYDQIYAAFDTPLMQQVRREAYSEDIGQHSWVTADELRADLERLAVTSSERLLDVGCGPCGPLVFAARTTGCRGTGLDASATALISGAARATAAGVRDRITLLEADVNLPIPLVDHSFDAVMSLDVVLHLRDRAAFFRDVARVLTRDGRFLFTDAGVITGPIASDEISRRSANGFAQFVPAGVNESLVAAAGLRLLAQEDRTASAVRNARGRLRALSAHRGALEALQGRDAIEHQQQYLETVLDVSERRALSRFMYLASPEST